MARTAWFNFGRDFLLDLIIGTSKEKDLQTSIVDTVRGTAIKTKEALKSGDTQRAIKLLEEQDQGAEAIAGAIVTGTPAERLVDDAYIHKKVHPKT